MSCRTHFGNVDMVISCNVLHGGVVAGEAGSVASSILSDLWPAFSLSATPRITTGRHTRRAGRVKAHSVL